MKNVFNFFILFIITLLIFAPFVNASSINMNLDEDFDVLEHSYDNLNNTTSSSDISNSSLNTTSKSDYTKPVINTQTETEFLTVENVLSIILIVIGILLILLAIAILIRFK